MKRVDLVRRISDAARRQGMEFDLVRSSGPHDIFRCGSAQTSIPRHREVGDKLALAIMRDLEPVLGPRWWT